MRKSMAEIKTKTETYHEPFEDKLLEIRVTAVCPKRVKANTKTKKNSTYQNKNGDAVRIEAFRR